MRKPAVTLPSVERVNILRDPPSSIHTRKKERVNVGDVMYNVRESRDRTSDNILYYSRGVNPMVSVSYGNTGGGNKLSSINTVGMANNPYKVVRNGAFRPPLIRQEDLLPLSRQRRANTIAQTRPAPVYQHKNVQEMTIDFNPVRASVLPRTTRDIGTGRFFETYSGNAVLDPLVFSVISKLKGTSTHDNYDIDWRDAKNYTTDRPLFSVISKLKGTSHDNYDIDGRDAKNYTTDRPLVSVISKLKGTSTHDNYDIDGRDVKNYILDKPLISYMTPGSTVLVYDRNTDNFIDLKLPEKKLKDIVATASKGGHIRIDGPNGQTVKLKDYKWKVVQSSKNTNNIILETSNFNINLQRNTPLTVVNSNINSSFKKTPEFMKIPELKSNMPIVSAGTTTPAVIYGVTPVNNRNVNLNATVSNLGGLEPKPNLIRRDRPDMIPSLYKKLK
jgi:hypothetical protein